MKLCFVTNKSLHLVGNVTGRVVGIERNVEVNYRRD